MRKLCYPFLAALVLAGCASTGAPDPEPEVMDVAGRYTFATTVQGMAVNGQLWITGAPGSYGGSIYTDVTGELPITSVLVDGQRVVLTGDTPDGIVEIRMLFEGDTFTGGWALGPEGGSIRGRKIRG